jgi:hypothetical protein
MSRKKKEPPTPLPPGCRKCHGRPHVPGDNGGAERCDQCARGRQLAEQDRARGLNSRYGAPVAQADRRLGERDE